MSLHNKPEYNTPEIVARLKAHGMEVDTPSMMSDAFRLGFLNAAENWRPARCENCSCAFGGADCSDVKHPKSTI